MSLTIIIQAVVLEQINDVKLVCDTSNHVFNSKVIPKIINRRSALLQSSLSFDTIISTLGDWLKNLRQLDFPIIKSAGLYARIFPRFHKHRTFSGCSQSLLLMRSVVTYNVRNTYLLTGQGLKRIGSVISYDVCCKSHFKT